jgi:hypothetical protein
METRLLKRSLPIVVAVCLVLVCTTPSYAASVILTLTRISTLTSVDDAVGAWQFDGGTVSLEGSVIGRYARVKRTVLGGGTDTQNTAMLTITIFFTGSSTQLTAPQTVTLQGSHSFSDNEERGGISAASSAFKGAVGITFEGPSAGLTTTLTFDVP